jgi:hypothetical protein
MDYSTQQYRHDEINLKRLVRRLEKSVSEQEWSGPSEDHWIRAQGTLQVSIYFSWNKQDTHVEFTLSWKQKVKHARKLLKNVDLYDEAPTP